MCTTEMKVGLSLIFDVVCYCLFVCSRLLCANIHMVAPEYIPQLMGKTQDVVGARGLSECLEEQEYVI